MTLEVISNEDMRRLHEASLTILEEVGIRVHHGPTVQLLADAGATVVTERDLRLPAAMVERAIEQAGKQHILYGRDRERQARFGHGRPNALSNAGEYAWVDPVKRTRRNPVTDDVRAAIRVGDALSGIDIVGSMAAPTDEPMEIRDIVAHRELIVGTTKPCAAWIRNGETARVIIEMFEALRGGAEALRQFPPIEGFIEPVSPLQFRRESLEILAEFARAGLPVGFGPMVICGSSGPVTLAGTLAQENAEILAGIVISQLLRPGLPVTYWGIPHILDPATANMVFGGPEQGLMAAAITQLGRRYGLPVGVNVGLTDAKVPDAQAGLEKGMTLLMGALAGADIFGHLGIAGMDQGSCLAQLIIDNEMLGHARRTLRGITIDDRSLALDVIRQVGPGGNYLAEEHTARSFRGEFFFPSLLDRNQWETWVAQGGTTMLDRALATQQRILATHEVPAPDADVLAEVDAIVDRARRTVAPTMGYLGGVHQCTSAFCRPFSCRPAAWHLAPGPGRATRSPRGRCRCSSMKCQSSLRWMHQRRSASRWRTRGTHV